MNSPALDIKDMLLSEESLMLLFKLTFGDNLNVAREPAKPNNCVTIYDTYGYPPQFNLDTQGYEFPAIQVRVRNTDYQVGWRIAEEIKNLLHGRAQETWNGTLYTAISCLSGPTFLEWDDSARVKFVINFNLQRRNSL